MGDFGPPPLRSEERRRTNEPDHPIWKLDTEALAAMPFEIDLSPRAPEPPTKAEVDGWSKEHPEAHWGRIATRLYEGLKTDPAVAWLTSGDWAWIELLIEDIDRETKPQVVGISDSVWDPIDQDVVPGEPIFELVPMKASKLAAFNQAMKSLGFGEANRLRIHKEVTLFGEFAETVSSAATEEAVVATRLELLQGGQAS